MHPHLGHSQQQVGRGCQSPDPTALLPRLHHPLSRSLLGAAMVQLVELCAEALLPGHIGLYRLHHDARVCAHAGKGVWVEAGHLVAGREHGQRALGVSAV